MAKLILHSECPNCAQYNPVAAAKPRASVRCRGCGSIYIACVPTVVGRLTRADAARLPWPYVAAVVGLLSIGAAYIGMLPRKSDAGSPIASSSKDLGESRDRPAAAPEVSDRPFAAGGWMAAVDEAAGDSPAVEERPADGAGAGDSDAQSEAAVGLTAAGTSFESLFTDDFFAAATVRDEVDLEDEAAEAAAVQDAAAVAAVLRRAVSAEVLMEDAEATRWAADDVQRLPNFDREGLVARLEEDGLSATRREGLSTFYEDEHWTVEIVGRGAEATLVRATCRSSTPLLYDRGFMANIAATAYSGSDSAGSHAWASEAFGGDSRRVAGRVEMIMRSTAAGASLELRPTESR